MGISRGTRRLPGASVSGACAALLAVLALAGQAVAELPAPENGHRPLRGNPVTAAPDPAPPAPFDGYLNAPAFEVVARQGELKFYPCAACHDQMTPNPERRKLFSPHPAALDHGDGRLWCLDCHAAEGRNELHTLAGERVSFDRADRVCAQCHYTPHRDWVFGAHGKRVADWQGERRIYSCAHCHDPHAPAVRPRAPEPPPPVRAGLSRPELDAGDHAAPWAVAKEEDREAEGQ
jgi:hypothetical protein